MGLGESIFNNAFSGLDSCNLLKPGPMKPDYIENIENTDTAIMDV